MSQKFCLKWNNRMTAMSDAFKNLLSMEKTMDVTIVCDGQSLKAHKIVLSACSPFFESQFLQNSGKYPIVVLTEMKYTDLKAIIDFMYHGEVTVAEDEIPALIRAAETLRIKGLMDYSEENNSGSNPDESSCRIVPSTYTPSKREKSLNSRKRKL